MENAGCTSPPAPPPRPLPAPSPRCRSGGTLTCMRKSCISSSAMRRPRHWRGPKPKPNPLKCLGPAASQRWGLNCSGLGKTSGSRPMA